MIVQSCMKPWNSAKFKKWMENGHGNISDFFNCNYLPSVNDSIPCLHKPVTCDSPPHVTNARITNDLKLKRTYFAVSKVKYECLDETFPMEGNSTVTCLYSGEWNKTLRCLERQCETKNGANLNLLSIVMPMLIILFFLFVILHAVRRKVKAKQGI